MRHMSKDKSILPKIAVMAGGATFAFAEIVVGTQDAAQAMQAQTPTLEDAPAVVSSTTSYYHDPIFDNRSLLFSLDSLKVPAKLPFTVPTKSSKSR